MIGWAIALALALAVIRLRRRLRLVALAEHELRAPLTAFALGVESARRSRGGGPIAALDAELARARVALDDLTAARRGRRAAPAAERVEFAALVRSSASAWAPAARHVRVDWHAGDATVCADRGRLAQALGNVIANAVEHGEGDVRISARRMARSLRVEVSNNRGHGLGIASAATRDAGGRLSLVTGPAGARATLDLPLA